ncbi:Ras family [Popillia japonica]|uniref:Ras family n=1 Tax=Popillia japonica TaxID=7064 RepID=A0AAW1HUE3_POPJA
MVDSYAKPTGCDIRNLQFIFNDDVVSVGGARLRCSIMENRKADVIRITVVGDGTVGKTCMLVRYVTNNIPTGYEPTIFETHNCTININEKPYNVILADTSGQEYLDKMRSFSYSFALSNCFLICFAVDSRTSFENISHVWIKDVRKANRKASIILVGTKSDLRKTLSETISKEEILKLVKDIKASGYVECSAFTKDGVDDVFNRFSTD